MEKPLNKRQQQYNATLEAIRGAVDKLMAEVGFEAMRIEDIAREAGISHGAFYHYFQSKNDLFVDRHLRSNADGRAYCEKVLSGMHPIDALKAFTEFRWQYTTTRIPQVLVQYHKIQLDDNEKWVAREPSFSLELVERLVNDGLSAGLIRPLYSPEQLAFFLMDFYRGSSYDHAMLHGEDLQGSARIQIVLDFLESLRA